MDDNNHHRFVFMLPSLLLLITFSLLIYTLYARRRRRFRHSPSQLITDDVVFADDRITIIQNVKPGDSNPNLLVNEPATAGDEECENKKKNKKKKRGNKKKQQQQQQRSDCDDLLKNQVVKKEKEKEKEGEEDLVCLYPFTSASSATQRRIKQQYDELVKSHEAANGLTLLQVGQFVNCLIEARNELKHKSEIIHRKFTITKALLFKADRSSFDRLRQQVYKLELEQKRLEEDAFVYNWLQQQLKLSPAYKKMLEVGAYMESKAKSVEATESDLDISDISFEELLAQEKKDSFWQKKGKPKSWSG